MKLKYYLRGLGIGMLVTAMILGFAGGAGQRMSDAQIRARAYELGMVDGSSKVLSDLQTGEPGDRTWPEASGEDPESKTPGGGGPDGQVLPPSSEGSGDSRESEPSGEPEASGESGPAEADNPSAGEGASRESAPQEGLPGEDGGQSESGGDASEGEVSITIQKGAGSESISRLLEEAGLVEDAGDFDRFLCENGYSKRLRAGTYRMLPGMSREEIADIITGH